MLEKYEYDYLVLAAGSKPTDFGIKGVNEHAFMLWSFEDAVVLIGLALIGGLFTFPASALSIVLQFMFVCTTGLYLNTFWMIFAGIAVLIGAGRTFGLDYYVMPWLKKKWKNIGWVINFIFLMINY